MTQVGFDFATTNIIMLSCESVERLKISNYQELKNIEETAHNLRV